MSRPLLANDSAMTGSLALSRAPFSSLTTVKNQPSPLRMADHSPSQAILLALLLAPISELFAGPKTNSHLLQGPGKTHNKSFSLALKRRKKQRSAWGLENLEQAQSRTKPSLIMVSSGNRWPCEANRRLCPNGLPPTLSFAPVRSLA